MKLSCFRSVVLLLSGLCAIPALAFGQEWTRFRGANGSGLSETAFPATFADKDFAWKTGLPGGGHSSPVLWGDKVFLTCGDDETARRMVVCVNAKDGHIAWTQEFGSHTYKKHGDNSYASATPVVDADRVYVCWNTPEEFTLMALKHDGSSAWKLNLGAFVSQHGGGNSPILVGDLLIIASDTEGKESAAFGIDRKTGKIVWKTPRKARKVGGFSAATPVVFHPASGGDSVVFCSRAEGMAGLDPRTGKVLWQLPTLFDLRTIGSPCVGNGIIYASCGESANGHQLAAVRPADVADAAPEIVWKTETETPYVPTPLVKGDMLYTWSDRGMVKCAHAATGEVVWQEHVPGSYFSSPICAGSTLFNVSKKGEVVAVATGDKFELLGQTPLNEKCHSTPAVAGGRMYVRTYTHLYCIKGLAGQAAR